MTDASFTFEVAPTTLTDAVYESLRQRIATGEIPPGEKITEARLTSEYKVARPTAKACIERLVSFGLLRRTAHKSAMVVVLGTDEVDDLFRVRATIESAAAELVAHSGNVPRAMLEAQRSLDVAGEFDDRLGLINADIDFHSSLVRASGSKRLARMHDLIAGEILLTMGNHAHEREAIPVVVSEHAAILQALRDRDVEEAVARLNTHLSAAHDRMSAKLPDETGTERPSAVN